MFGRLTRLVDNFKSIDAEILFFQVFIKSNVQDFVIDLNRFDQLFKESETADGQFLPNYLGNYGGTYTFRNSDGETFTREKNRDDGYFLLDTGELYNSFKFTLDGDGFTIDADTIKVTETDEGFDSIDYDKFNIIGLTDESKQKLIQKILPMVIGEVRETLLS